MAYERIFEILEEAGKKFDFSVSVDNFEIRNHQVYLSNSPGLQDWKYPAKKELTWDNPLTAISNCGDCEFNFVFKNGKTSDAPMTAHPTQVVRI